MSYAIHCNTNIVLVLIADNKHQESFDGDITYDKTEAAQLRAMICMLGELNSPSFSSITSDDLAIILDSGASCCMSPFKNDFIDGTYNV